MSSEHERICSFIDALRGDIESHLVRVSDPRLQFALKHLFDKCTKKLKTSDLNLSDVALDDFLRFNRKARRVSLDLPSEVVSEARLFITEALEHYTSSFSDVPQDCLNVGHLCSLWRYGPGASNGIELTHFCDKVVQQPTATETCAPFTRLMRSLNPYLKGFDAKMGWGIRTVNGSRITTVPKNDKTDRVIAIEPLGNMMCQLAAGRYIEGALRTRGIDITNQQELNKHLAFVGSRDGSWATIDLKHASDMITPKLVRLLWPKEWYSLFCAFRSPVANIRGEDVKLNMISTMGNGFTFPMMTMTILALCKAVCGSNYVAVFGDDIIVKTSFYDDVCTTLQQAGLLVNTDKSFAAGPFRESCGGDYYSGYEVTPFYVKSLNSSADIYIALNQVLTYCGKHQLFFSKTIDALKVMLGKEVLYVPEWMPDYSGVRRSTVPRLYKYLEAYGKLKLCDHELAMFCTLGGYTQSYRGGAAYIPRSRMKYRLRNGCLPSGWTNGRCAARLTTSNALVGQNEDRKLTYIRGQAESHWIDLILDLV